MSNYHGERCAAGGWDCITSPMQAIAAANSGGATVGTKGVEVASDFDNVTGAVKLAQQAGAALLVAFTARRLRPAPCTSNL